MSKAFENRPIFGNRKILGLLLINITGIATRIAFIQQTNRIIHGHGAWETNGAPKVISEDTRE